jgi:hypothetical protein
MQLQLKHVAMYLKPDIVITSVKITLKRQVLLYE